MRIDTPGETRAARALLDHIRANYRNVPEFAEAHGLDRVKLQKAIRGKLQRIDVPFALAVERATKGAVLVAWWDEREVRTPHRRRGSARPARARQSVGG